MRLDLTSLRMRVLLLVLLAILPALVLTIFTATELRQNISRRVQAEATRLVQMASENEERFIENGHQLLMVLAQLPEVRQQNPAACAAFLGQLRKQNPIYANFGIAHPDGQLACSATPTTKTLNVADRTYFRQAMQTKKFSIGEFQTDRINGKATINLGYPVLDEAGQVQAVLFAALDLGWLNDLASELHLPTGSVLTVTDRNGTILVRYPHPEQWVGRNMNESEVVKTALARNVRQTAELTGIDGVKRLYAFAPLSHRFNLGEAYVHVGIPTSVAYAELSDLTTRNIITLLLVGILTLAAGWFGTEYLILRYINAMVSATRRLSAGDLSARTGVAAGHGELIELAHTFDQMAKSMQSRQEFTTSLLEDLPIGVVACDTDGNLMLFNRTARKWHGLEGKHLPPDEWGNYYDVYDAEGNRPLDPEEHPLTRVLEGKRVEHATISIAAKGEPLRRVLAHGGPLIDAKGHKIGSMIIMQDITHQDIRIPEATPRSMSITQRLRVDRLLGKGERGEP